MQKRIFFVGDVHGCFKELKLLLKKAGYDSQQHRLILLGDLINKGPQSFEVLSWVRADKQVVALLGNHEWKFIQSIENKLPLSPELEKLKQDMGKDIKDWILWLKSWPIYIEEESFLAVHGGLVPGEDPRSSKKENLINIRYWGGKESTMKDSAFPPWHEQYTQDKVVIYAHWAQQGLKVKNNSIGLDTGCVYGKKLTGLWLPERKIVQVSSSQPQKRFTQ